MTSHTADVVVAGHICLDIIPAFDSARDSLESVLQPGQLIEVGAAVLAPGGAVSNTGMALHRLGLSPRLVGKVGDDLFGDAIVDRLRRRDEWLVRGMIRARDASSSYTIVISPPNTERFFLHSPGANRTFRPEEVPLADLTAADLFHLGYPPLLRPVFLDGGEQLAALFREAQEEGMAVSLDMSLPDPDSESGRVDWGRWLTRVLPYVDLFAPNLEEILFMLDRPRYRQLKHQDDAASLPARADTELLDRLARGLLDRGAPLVALKLGDQGAYLRTTEDPGRLEGLHAALGLDPRRWSGRQLLLSPFETEVVGTTGAGDAAVAGLLVGLHRGLSPETTLRSAVAVGTFNVEAADATSGIPDWETVQARLHSGWAQLPLDLSHPGWTWSDEHGVWIGPQDRAVSEMNG